MKKFFLTGIMLSGLLGCCLTTAQDVAYKLPPKEIQDIALAKLPPGVMISNDNKWLLLLDRAPFLSVEELAQPEYKLAGARVTGLFGPSRREGYSGVRLLDIKTREESAIAGLPSNVNILEAEWSPASSHLALVLRGDDGYYLWTVSIADRQARQASRLRLNLTGGRVRINWLGETEVVVPTVPSSAGAFPEPSRVPGGPLVQTSDGKATPARTYQDLLKSPYDELLFDYLFTAQLTKISPEGETAIGKPAIYSQVSLSPDRQYLLTATVDRPYPYTVPMQSFPQTVSVIATDGRTVKELGKHPMVPDGTGYDVSSPYPRNYGWRADKPATLYWTEALDEGNPRKNPAPFMDAVYQFAAPFDGEKQLLVKTEFRTVGIQWCDDAFALVRESSRRTRRIRTYSFAPSKPEQASVPVFDVSTDDGYANPGMPVTVRDAFNRPALYTNKNHSELLMTAQGASPEGDMPYLSRYDLKTKKNTILWRCEAPYYETVVDMIDPAGLKFITARQSIEEPVNYFVRDARKKTAYALTSFPSPYPQLEGMKVEKMQYRRADGLDLTATLYTPVGYDRVKDGRLPVLMWAYPREYRSADDAAQVRGSKYLFTTITYRSPVFWVTRGYAVMDNVEMPIVGSDGAEPNDSFIEQLTMNAEAAAKAIFDTGVGDTSRMAVGGHSYGGFMTANLLMHTRLFKAGIARSGAYNRSLTPFGFQAETRTYWEAPEVYYRMSPFNYANRLSGALLLVHGEHDNNSGTFPIQSERLFAAIKGHGGISRLVILPYESHAYSAKENILHLLCEVDEWLDRYVKNNGQ
ncbi:MAG: prolyl oligopeptidase family serine peptidase [Tannerella sp.]|jgi:dipeptidyl aminopeptidase/acylaminoacyl peptidase|nr:prolyl oligopeptidase family serine peptidase [Tannerella sp.]